MGGYNLVLTPCIYQKLIFGFTFDSYDLKPGLYWIVLAATCLTASAILCN